MIGISRCRDGLALPVVDCYVFCWQAIPLLILNFIYIYTAVVRNTLDWPCLLSVVD